MGILAIRKLLGFFQVNSLDQQNRAQKKRGHRVTISLCPIGNTIKNKALSQSTKAAIDGYHLAQASTASH